MSTKAVEQLVSTVRAARAICETSAIGPKALHESENMYERLLRFAIQGNQFDKVCKRRFRNQIRSRYL